MYPGDSSRMMYPVGATRPAYWCHLHDNLYYNVYPAGGVLHAARFTTKPTVSMIALKFKRRVGSSSAVMPVKSRASGFMGCNVA